MVTAIKTPPGACPPPKADIKRQKIAMAVIFMFFGFNIGTWVSRLVTIKADLALTDSELSLLLLASGLGAVSAFVLVIALIKRLGEKKTLLLTGLTAALLLVALSLSANYYLSLVIMFCEGVLCAAINTAINALANRLEQQSKQKIISRLHACFSLGVFVGALFSSAILWLSQDLWLHFIIAALIMTASLLCCYRHLVDKHHVLASISPSHLTSKKAKNASTTDGEVTDSKTKCQQETEGKQTQCDTQNHHQSVKVILMLGITLFLSTLVEGSMLDWSSIYLTEVVGADEIFSPSGVAVFSLMMVLARLYADNWRNKYSDLRLIGIGSTVCGINLLLGLSINGLAAAWLMFAVAGLSIAAICPCIYAIAAKNGTARLSLMATFGSIGTLLGPPLIGWISDSAGLVAGFYLVGVCCLLVALLAGLLHLTQKKAALSPNPLAHSV